MDVMDSMAEIEKEWCHVLSCNWRFMRGRSPYLGGSAGKIDTCMAGKDEVGPIVPALRKKAVGSCQGPRPGIGSVTETRTGNFGVLVRWNFRYDEGALENCESQENANRKNYKGLWRANKQGQRLTDDVQ